MAKHRQPSIYTIGIAYFGFGCGEVAVLSLALENPDRIVLLDDTLARRIAQAAGLHVWGTLKVLLEAKSCTIIDRVEPYVLKLGDAGMWISAEIKERILDLAGESRQQVRQ